MKILPLIYPNQHNYRAIRLRRCGYGSASSAVWVEQQGICAGSRSPLNFEELLKVDGLAVVHAVEPCPKIATGPGNAVTGRFVTYGRRRDKRDF